MKSIKITDYFEMTNIKKELSYYKIIPHQNTRNYKSIEIANIINKCYKDLNTRITKLEDDFIYDYEIKSQTKVAYYIHVSKNKGVEFFLIVPTVYASMFIEKVSLTWNKVEMKKVNDIPRFSDDCTKMSVQYTREDALSLDIIDKKSCDLLEAQLNVMNMMQDDDRIGIYYNFNYKNSQKQKGFRTRYNETMDKIKDGKNVDKIRDSKSIGKLLLKILMLSGEEIMDGISSLLGGEKKSNNDVAILKKNLGILQKKDLSKYTKEKGQLETISTQILIMSESQNKENEKLNISSLAQSFNKLDGDNKLRPKVIGIKRKIDLDRSKLPIPSNDMSIEEYWDL
ncbi:hypothetical protein QJS64_12325 [Paraclostridium bifermentans]|uniref:Uncharacterized protein n=1 Tax=Paraclostridium bifermentans TaxID=1490 RepID=A0ABY8R2H3_PARBF|nr:hypothetical protein QJS64_12325 [Paraclostridium bifermentans]